MKFVNFETEEGNVNNRNDVIRKGKEKEKGESEPLKWREKVFSKKIGMC